MGLEIDYVPRTAIKSQALADFIADWTSVQANPDPAPLEFWTMHFDGSFTLNGAGGGVLLTSPRGDELRYVLRLHFQATNTMAEYEALLHGLRMAIELGVRRLRVKGDSDLVVTQVMKTASCRDTRMTAYCQEVRRLESKFDGLELIHVPRRENETADSLAWLASARGPVLTGVFTTDQSKPSIELDDPDACPTDSTIVATLGCEPREEAIDWRGPLLDYLVRGILPEDQSEARRLARKAKSYVVQEGELYRKSAIGILSRCIPIMHGREIVEKIH
jgi:ribonuclease HI